MHNIKRITTLFALFLPLLLIGCSNSSGSSDDVTQSTDPLSPTITLEKQSGTIMPGRIGNAYFAASTTNIDDGQTGSVTWYKSQDGKDVASVPTGISTQVKSVIYHVSGVSIDTAMNTVPGTYYFTLTIGTTTSAVTTFTVLPISGIYIGANKMPKGECHSLSDPDIDWSNYTAGIIAEGTWNDLTNCYSSVADSYVSSIAGTSSVIYAGGYCVNTSGVDVAGYWVNGIWNALSNPFGEGCNARVNALVLSGSTLYAGGYCMSSSGANGQKVPGYWVNGVWNALSNGVASGKDAIVKTLTLLNGTVYAAGYCKSSAGIKEAGYWMGTSGTWKAIVPLDGYNSEINGIAASASEVYGVGYTYNGSIKCPVLWHITQNTFTPYGDSTIINGLNYGINEVLTSIAIVGNTIYAGGYKGTDNSITQNAIPPQGIVFQYDVTQNTAENWTLNENDKSYVYAIAATGSNVYSTGCLHLYPSLGDIGYWTLFGGWETFKLDFFGRATSIIVIQ